ncbi:hypothetical protein VUR80DRAFT_1889 [Thermomyces stellatus]
MARGPHASARLPSEGKCPLAHPAFARQQWGYRGYPLSPGLSKPLLAVVWFAGPLIDILVQAYVGAVSDNCGLRWARRRPYLLAGMVVTVLSMTGPRVGAGTRSGEGGRGAMVGAVSGGYRACKYLAQPSNAPEWPLSLVLQAVTRLTAPFVQAVDVTIAPNAGLDYSWALSAWGTFAIIGAETRGASIVRSTSGASSDTAASRLEGSRGGETS